MRGGVSKWCAALRPMGDAATMRRTDSPPMAMLQYRENTHD
jgi:hypothetical protein